MSSSRDPRLAAGLSGQGAIPANAAASQSHAGAPRHSAVVPSSVPPPQTAAQAQVFPAGLTVEKHPTNRACIRARHPTEPTPRFMGMTFTESTATRHELSAPKEWFHWLIKGAEINNTPCKKLRVDAGEESHELEIGTGPRRIRLNGALLLKQQLGVQCGDLLVLEFVCDASAGKKFPEVKAEVRRRKDNPWAEDAIKAAARFSTMKKKNNATTSPAGVDRKRKAPSTTAQPGNQQQQAPQPQPLHHQMLQPPFTPEKPPAQPQPPSQPRSQPVLAVQSQRTVWDAEGRATRVELVLGWERGERSPSEINRSLGKFFSKLEVAEVDRFEVDSKACSMKTQLRLAEGGTVGSLVGAVFKMLEEI